MNERYTLAKATLDDTVFPAVHDHEAETVTTFFREDSARRALAEYRDGTAGGYIPLPVSMFNTVEEVAE
ncbi:hypothetical protein SEA_CARON_33 [Microbacterium phage Caron]|uniref:Uncharacterized protein n=1 Tax=Microbacterium phage Caron TaxID=3028494 RepID=A0AAE9ZTG8_9CAUD|nr:hypothetical protein SEA_CARON_33 [Microbacterium phage Caron]